MAVVRLARGLTRLVVMFARAELMVGVLRVVILAVVRFARGLERLVMAITFPAIVFWFTRRDVDTMLLIDAFDRKACPDAIATVPADT